MPWADFTGTWVNVSVQATMLPIESGGRIRVQITRWDTVAPAAPAEVVMESARACSSFKLLVVEFWLLNSVGPLVSRGV